MDRTISKDQATRSANQQASETPLPWSDLDLEQRITLMLIESNAAYRLPVLEEEELAATKASWMRVLKGIPSRFLQRCYETAIARHAGAYPLTAYEVKEVWVSAFRGAVKQWTGDVLALNAGPPCEFCNNTGFKRVKRISDNEGLDVLWNSSEDTNSMVRCHCRKVE